MVAVQDGFIIRVGPKVAGEGAEFLPYCQKADSIVDDCFNLAPGTDHALCIQNALNVIFVKFCDFPVIKIAEALPEDLPLLQHHIEIQPALHDFQQQVFKLLLIIVDRGSPFFLMIFLQKIILIAPAAICHILYRPD